MSERELILPDDAHLLPLTYALRAGWVAAPFPVRWMSTAAAREEMAGSGAVVLADPLAYTAVASSHAIVTDVAVTARFHSTAALVTSQRPDFLEQVEIDARDVTPTTAALAQVLGREHFGASSWRITREPGTDAAARLVDGDAALRALAEAEPALEERYRQEPAAGSEADEVADQTANAEGSTPTEGMVYAEDLGRAWFVLTGLPWVSAVLFAPRELVAQGDDLRAVVGALRESLRAGREQEATIVRDVTERLHVPESLVRRLFQARRYELATDERKTVDRLFQRALRYRIIAPLTEVAVVTAGGSSG